MPGHVIAPFLLLSLMAAGYAPDPTPVNLSVPQQLAVARAAGLTVKGTAIFDDCDQKIDQISFTQTDLNGDKVPELIVAPYSMCWGNGGHLSSILRRMPGGAWQRVFNENGDVGVLKTSRGGWHDIEVGGPGMGRMPVVHWNGKEYR